MKSLWFWLGVPVAAFAAGAMVGVGALGAALVSASGVLAGIVLASVFAGLAAFGLAEGIAPDGSRGAWA